MIVYGHRGAQGEAPENTIAGCKHAVARGVRHLEIDLRLSKDLELVVIHDDRLKRTARVRGTVLDLTAKELAKLDARGSGPPWPSKKQTGIPTLHALYQAVPEIETWQLELKGGRQSYNENLVAALAEWLADDHEGCIVTSSEPSMILAMKQIIPDLDTGLVSMYPDPTDTLKECDCSHLIAAWATAGNPWLVRSLHRQKIHISAWTVNDATAIKNLFRLKIDSIITDYPSMALPLVAALERKQQRK
ncbi:MAG: glycerophosphodiester phosphodiesterase [Gammaproteobacteria bacterium]|nr:glycerophosphodiester phosphodiesterase [Gammaproteobacteria bacterium]